MRFRIPATLSVLFLLLAVNAHGQAFGDVSAGARWSIRRGLRFQA